MACSDGMPASRSSLAVSRAGTVTMSRSKKASATAVQWSSSPSLRILARIASSGNNRPEGVYKTVTVNRPGHTTYTTYPVHTGTSTGTGKANRKADMHIPIKMRCMHAQRAYRVLCRRHQCSWSIVLGQCSSRCSHLCNKTGNRMFKHIVAVIHTSAMGLNVVL